jgi:hypothetical protein
MQNRKKVNVAIKTNKTIRKEPESTLSYIVQKPLRCCIICQRFSVHGNDCHNRHDEILQRLLPKTIAL